MQGSDSQAAALAQAFAQGGTVAQAVSQAFAQAYQQVKLLRLPIDTPSI